MTQNKLSLCAVSTLLVGTVVGSSSCGKASAGKAFDFPAVATIVASSTPAGLKSSTTSSFQLRQIFVGFLNKTLFNQAFAAAASTTNVTSSLTAMFKGTFAKVSGGTGTGYISSNLQDLDSRVSSMEDRFTVLPTCFKNTLTDMTVDFVNHADAKLALKVNCRDEFTWKSGDAGSPGSGMVIGKRDKTSTLAEMISMTLLLKHKTTSADGGTDSYDAGFGYAGVVNGSGTSDEEVEMLFGQFNTKSSLGASDEDQPLMARIYTKTATKAFEVAMASTNYNSGGPMSGGTSYLGCGFRMISNGTIIVAKGNYMGSGTCSGGTPDTIDVCLDATSLADVSTTSASACATLAATTFHIASSSTSLATFTSSTLTANTVTASNNIFSALKPNSAAVKAITSSISN